MSTSDDSLYWACVRGDKHLVLKLASPNNVNYVSPNQICDTPLHQACKQGWLDVVKLLIEKYGCDPNVRTRSNKSVLHHACQCGHIDIVEYLINEWHLDPLLRDNHQLEPLDCALSNNRTVIAVYICQHCISSDEMLNPNRIKTTIKLMKYILRDTSQPASKWKSANGDNILQLMGSSISHIPSIIVLDMLNSGNAKHISVFKPDCKTSDGYNLLELTCQSEIYLSQTLSGLILKWLGDATVNRVKKSIPDSKTADGITLIQLVCQSEICISHVSTAVLSKWLSDTTSLLAKNITPEWKTADGDTLLQLVCQSNTIVSRISSTVLIKWLNDSTTTLDVMKIPNLRTADGVRLFQVICQSEKCLVQISSKVFLKWLWKNPHILVSISIPDCKTADGDTLLQLILHSEVSMSKTSSTVLSNLLSDSREISVDQMKMVHPNWKTLDGIHFLHALCQSNVEDIKIIELMQHYILKDGLNPDTFLDSERNTVLHIACRANKLAVVSYLISQAHCDSNIKNKIGCLPLDMTNNPKVIDYLCQHNRVAVYSKTIIKWMNNLKSVDDTTMLCILKSLVDNHRCKTEDGNTLLHVLCMHSFIRDNMRFVDFLLAEGHCDPNCLNSDGKTPLQVTSDSKIMTKLLEHGAKMPADVVFKLIMSSEKDSIIHEILTLSIRKQAMLWNPNKLNSDGYTALHLACKANKLAVVSYLIDQVHCDPNIKNKKGSLPLDMTTDPKIIKYLCQHDHIAVYSKTIVEWMNRDWLIDDSTMFLILKSLIENHRYKTKDGSTLLHVLCMHTFFRAYMERFVDFLLTECHCDPNCLDSNGQMPLQVTSNPRIMTKLLEHGAKMTADVVFKLIMSNKTGSIINEILTLSIRKQAMRWNPNELNGDGYTALHLACKADNPSTMNILLSEAHCDPNCLDGNGKTPLQVTSNSKIMTILIEHGAKVTADVVFKLIMSNKTGSIINEILTLSIRKQAMLWNPNELSIDGYTALHLACKANKLAVVSYLINQAHCDPTNPEVINYLCQHDDVEVYSETIVGWMKNLETFDDATILHILKSLADNHRYKTKDGSTLLHVLCMHSFVRANMERFVDFLFTEGHCDPNCLDSNGQMPLQVTSNPRIMTKLLEHGAKMPADVVFKLIMSSEKDSIIHEILTLSIRKQAMLWNPNKLNSDGYTALHLACKANKLAVVSYLIDQVHCDPNIKNKMGGLPLDMTTDPKIIKYLCQHDHIAVYSKTIVEWMNRDWLIDDSTMFLILKSLIENHRYKTKDGSTLLHVLCMDTFFRAYMERFVDFLLTECHCDPNCLDSNGQMPLQVTSNPRIMTKLLEHGAKMPADVVFKLIMSSEKDSIIHEILTLSIRKQAMLWNPNELNSNGYTALHLACKAGNPSLVNLLLSEAHCDPNFKSINEDVPLQMTTNPEIIKNLIRHGAKTSIMYESHRKHLGTDKPVQPPVKVFIVGNPSVGKSTLTAALKKKVGVIARIFSGKVSGVDRKTVGIVPHDLENKIFGRVTLYDFAGHREFYSGHAALLQTAIQSTPPIFLLVINLCEDKSEIVKNILYWISFLENQCASVSCKPHIILVGSHADTLRGVNPKDKVKTIIDSLDAKCFINMVYIDFVAMNCQYHESTGMSDLRRLLIKSCEELRIQEPITFNAHCFLVFLIDTFMDLTAVTIKIVSENIKYQQSKEGLLEFLPRNIEALYKICLELNDRGHILLLKDRIAIENSYIVIDKEFLLSEISGTVFAPEGFKQYKELSSNTGVVPLSKIVKSFPDKDVNVLIGYLTHLEFCHEISDQALLQRISKDYSRTSENEHYYLFPGLISLEAETNMWQTESHFSLHFGWILQCTNLAQFFTSWFLQVLLLRLAFSLALESKCDDDDIIGIHRKCSIWKNGIFWGREFGMETLVEVIEDKSVIVMARFQTSNLEKCIKHRSEVIHTVLECLDRFCPRVSTTESFIDASSPLKFPFALNFDRTLCTVQDLAQAMVGNCVSPSVVLSGCGKTVPAERFLSFEPYTEIEPLVLQELWDVNNEDTIISDNFLSKFVRKLSSSKLYWFTKIFNNSADIPSNKNELFHELCKWRGSEMMYKHFHQKLDQYSVFAGRNVLVSISYHHRILRNTLIHLPPQYIQDIAGYKCEASSVEMDEMQIGSDQIPRLIVEGIIVCACMHLIFMA